MNQEAKYFRIGLFVLVGIFILAASLILFGGGKIFQPKLNFETYVKGSVQGIDVGSPVKFRGVSIGKVSDVTFVFNEYPNEQESGLYNYVCLLMEVTKPVFPDMFSGDIHKQIDEAVEKGLRVRIEPQGITGMNYLEIDYVDPKLFPVLVVDWTPRNYYIPSAPGQLTSILDSVNKIMRDVGEFQLEEIGKQTVSLLQGLNKAVAEANLGEVSTDTRKLIQELEKMVQQAKIEELSESTRKALNELTSAVSDLKIILANIEPATRLNSDDINAALANFRIISDNLRVLSGDAKKYPSRLFFGSPPAKSDVMDPPAGPVREKTKKRP